MARTVDTEAHAVRREAFVDVALSLVQTKGYDQMSVQDVLDELDASRGAFYHYFDSKAALLDAVVTRIVDGAIASVAPLVDDPDVAAVPKLEGLFGGIAQWKLERTELMLAIARVWLSDENALTRDKMWRGVTTQLAPLLATVVRQGIDEGVFTASSPDEAARVVVALMHGLNDAASRAFVNARAGGGLAEMERLVDAYVEALERILGVAAGSLVLVDRAMLPEWFS